MKPPVHMADGKGAARLYCTPGRTPLHRLALDVDSLLTVVHCINFLFFCSILRCYYFQFAPDSQRLELGRGVSKVNGGSP